MNLPRVPVFDSVRVILRDLRRYLERVSLEVEQADRENLKRTGDIDFPHDLKVRGVVTLDTPDPNVDIPLVMTDPDVAHALFPSVWSTDTFASFGHVDDLIGGLNVSALAEDAALNPVLGFQVYGGTATTTKSTAGRSLVEFLVSENNGAGGADNVAADGNVFGIRARRGGSNVTVLIVDEDGDLWIDGALAVGAGGVALGGGATPTLGTIGGSGPTTAAQAQWLQVDIAGTTHWIPVWT